MMGDPLAMVLLACALPLSAQTYLYWSVFNGNRDDIDISVLLRGLVPILGLVPLLQAHESQRTSGLTDPDVVLTDPGVEIDNYLAAQQFDDLGLDDLDTMEHH